MVVQESQKRRMLEMPQKFFHQPATVFRAVAELAPYLGCIVRVAIKEANPIRSCFGPDWGGRGLIGIENRAANRDGLLDIGVVRDFNKIIHGAASQINEKIRLIYIKRMI